MRPADVEFVRANSVDEALAAVLLGAGTILAGGQGLLRDMRQRLLQPRRLIDISRIGDLAHIQADKEAVVIGATVTLANLSQHKGVRTHCYALTKAASLIGDVQVRARATAVGNVCGAWLPAGWSVDIGVVLAASRGQVIVRGPSGERLADASDFLSMPNLPLQAGEMITALRFPSNNGSAYVRLSRRYADAGIGSAAVCVKKIGGRIEVGIAFGQVHEHVVRAPEIEALVETNGVEAPQIDRALEAFAASLNPPDTAHAGHEYRRQIVPVVAKRALREAFSHIQGG